MRDPADEGTVARRGDGDRRRQIRSRALVRIVGDPMSWLRNALLAQCEMVEPGWTGFGVSRSHGAVRLSPALREF
jgi:hypothetical protein